MARQGRPYPYDAVINGTPVMLQESQGQLAWFEQRAQEVETQLRLGEEDLAFVTAPPQISTPYAVTDLSLGMGAYAQSPEQRQRYQFSQFTDCSSGQPVKGPAVNAQTGIGAKVEQFVEFNGALYASRGVRLYKRADDTAGGWAQVGADFAANIGQMAVFQGTQTAPFLFVPIGSGAAYFVVSTIDARTQHASQRAEGFEVRGDELWLSNTESSVRVIRKATDGGTAATWGAVTTVGDPTKNITWLKTVADRLLVIKEDGINAPTISNATIVDAEVVSSLRSSAASDNGKGAINWNEELVFRFGNGLFRYNPDSGELSQFGPELLEQNDSEVTGVIRAVASQAGICLWGGLYNAATGDSHLVRYGSWKVGRTDRGIELIFIPAWHGALYSWDTKQITALAVTSLFDSGRPRLYVGFADGAISWCKLARTHVAADDAEYLFDTVNDGYVYYPRYTANVPLQYKLFKQVGVVGRDLLSGVRTLGVEYRVPGAAGWTGAGTAGADPGTLIQVAGTPTNQVFDVRVKLTNTSATISPRLDALVLYSALRGDQLKDLVVAVQAIDNARDRRGQPMRQSGQDIRTALEAAVSQLGPFPVLNPAGEEISVIGLNYQHQLLGYDPDGWPRWRTTLRLVQVAGGDTQGSWDNLSNYRWDDLASFTWDQVSSL